MKKKIITCITLFALIAMNAISTFAALDQRIYLKENQVWTAYYPDARSTKYSFVTAKCDAVYPISGADNFTRIQTRALNKTGAVITEKAYTILTEGEASTKLYIKEGYFDTTTVNFQFRGNSASSAYAIVDYYAS